ncbi:MAG: metallophosphoesterase [Bacilli bacterium]|nr:metallophosphoesterase [Bacilli bacterium]
MKNKFLLLIPAIFAVSLTSCGQTVSYKSGDNYKNYIRELNFHNNFNILQLTDIHWNGGTQVGDNTYGSESYLKKVIEEASKHSKGGKLDLIEITGDTFMLANASHVTAFINFISSFNIPYAIIWGNHDRENSFNPNWLSDQFRHAPNCLYTEIDNDDVYERSNYVINLVDQSKTVKWQIFNVDSGSSLRKGAFDLGLSYDYIHQDQLEWMKYQNEKANNVPAIAYYHIAQKEVEEIYDMAQKNDAKVTKSKFFKLEGFGISDNASNIHMNLKSSNVKGVFMGHAHSIDWTATYDGITYGFGVKSGTELYYASLNSGMKDESKTITIDKDIELIGASLVSITDDSGDFTIEHLYYNELMEGDDVRWYVY